MWLLDVDLRVKHFMCECPATVNTKGEWYEDIVYTIP